MTTDQAHKSAYAMSKGRYGSFAEFIGCAYLVADNNNKETLLEAFKSLFETVLSDITERA